MTGVGCGGDDKASDEPSISDTDEILIVYWRYGPIAITSSCVSHNFVLGLCRATWDCTCVCLGVGEHFYCN